MIDAGERECLMRRFVDECWNRMGSRGVSWVGFYLDTPGAPDDQRLALGPCRDKPACSPIGLHGACGKCLLSGQPLIVRDVADLGPSYIACDPRDRSELVLPCRLAGRCWGVLDLDSHAVGTFTQDDANSLAAALRDAGLDCP